MREAVVFAIAAIFITTVSVPAISSTNNNEQPILWVSSNNQPVLSPEEHALRQSQAYKPVEMGRGWYWKPPYPNYAPNTPGGMPDFDQKQDAWKAIGPGSNGVIDSTPAGDDYYNPSENCIVPGPNCKIDTTPAGDDVAYWAFCGPVAVANCFWWFDSKYADPAGTPGDGNDIFDLVQDYGVGDDHSAANVPLLIEKLAGYFQTCSKGTTYIDDMQNGIDQWFIDTNLDNFFEENTYNEPEFDFIEAEIERSQDVIILIGYYNREKIVDQQQTIWTSYIDLPTWTPGHLQEFVPNVNILDAVQVLLAANYPGVPTDVKVCIWDVLPNQDVDPLGCSVMTIVPPGLDEPAWFQFHFDPQISLIPGNLYFISVEELTMDYNIHWYYHIPDIYLPGISWWETAAWVFAPQPDKDFCFKTEYYGDDCYRTGGHYLTCAGVNSEDLKIAVSDPCWDITNPTADPTLHNDPQYVSHDIYDVVIGCPCPLPYNWWLPDFPAACDYAIVEQAVVICPINSPPNKPTITGPTSGNAGTSYPYTFTSTDPDGDQVSYYIKWGDGSITDWTAFQASGPPGYSESHTWTSQGTYTIEAKAKDIYGQESDWATLTVTMPRNRAINRPFLSFLQNHPNLFPILMQLLQRLGL